MAKIKSPAAKFRKAADGLQKTIDKYRADRLVNTQKRFKEWETALSNARYNEVLQDRLRALANLWDEHAASGNDKIEGVLSYLQGITSKAQLERLLQYGSAPREDIDSDEYNYFKKMGIVGDVVFNKAKAALIWIGGDDVGKETTAETIRRMEIEVALRNVPGYFPTPPALTEVLLTHLLPGETYERVLEPSAGSGHMVEVIKNRLPDAQIDCIEWNFHLSSILKLKGYNVIGDDLLNCDLLVNEQGAYDLVVMNPPFEKGADIEHVMRAYELVRHGGTLLAIMSAGPFFRTDKKSEHFREWLISVNGTDYELPEGSFKQSDRSTGVNTRYVVIHKPAKPVVVVAETK